MVEKWGESCDEVDLVAMALSLEVVKLDDKEAFPYMTMDRGDLHPRNSNLGANGASFGNREGGTGFRNGELESEKRLG